MALSLEKSWGSGPPLPLLGQGSNDRNQMLGRAWNVLHRRYLVHLVRVHLYCNTVQLGSQQILSAESCRGQPMYIVKQLLYSHRRG
jgi:hypothetical protein